MKKRILLNKVILCTVALLTLSNFAVEVSGEDTKNNFQPVFPDQMSSILTMISNETQSNYDKIKIWQGKVDVTTGKIYEGTEAERVFKNKTDGVGQAPKKVKKIKETSVEFAIDYKKGLSFDKEFYRSPLKYVDTDSGRVLGTKSIVGNTTTITTPEYRITNVPVITREDVIITRQAVKEKRAFEESCTTCKKDFYDPRYAAIGGRGFRPTFLVLLNYIEEHGEFSIDGHSLRIEERVGGTTTEYRVEIPSQVSPGEFVFKTMIFNSDKGFNITLSETRSADDKLYQKVTWEYEIINGVYLPKRRMIQNFKGENAELGYERKCIFTNLRLNQAIPENTFTYKNLGLKNDDILIDKIKNKKYTYQKDGSLKEIIKK